MNIALYMVCPDNLYNPMNLTSYCLNYLVFSFVLSRYQVVHGFWREILIWGVEWRGGRGECRGGGRGKHRITGGHRALALVILHEVVQVGLWDSKNVKNSLKDKNLGNNSCIIAFLSDLFASWFSRVSRGKDECFWIWAIQHVVRVVSCSTFLLSFGVAQWSFDFS